MKSFIKLCLVVAACAGTFAQNAPEQTSNAASAPAAFVYVSAKGGIYAFSAAANGKLTPVAGSPFKGQLTGMAVNGKYLFGAGASLRRYLLLLDRGEWRPEAGFIRSMPKNLQLIIAGRSFHHCFSTIRDRTFMR